MKRKAVYYFIAGIVFLAVVGFFLFLWKTPRFQREIICREPDFNAGRIAVENDGCQFEHTFKLENIGKRKFEIIAYESSCPCVELHMPTRELLPNSSINLIAKAGFPSNNMDFRTIRLRLETDSPDKENRKIELTLTFAAQFQPRLSTSFLDFGEVFSGHIETRTVYALWPDEIGHESIVKKIQLDTNEEINFMRQSVKLPVANEKKPENYFVSSEAIEIKLSPKTLGEKKFSAYVHFVNDSTREIKIWYKTCPPSVFLPENYYFSKDELLAGNGIAAIFVQDFADIPVEFYTKSNLF